MASADVSGVAAGIGSGVRARPAGSAPGPPRHVARPAPHGHFGPTEVLRTFVQDRGPLRMKPAATHAQMLLPLRSGRSWAARGPREGRARGRPGPPRPVALPAPHGHFGPTEVLRTFVQDRGPLRTKPAATLAQMLLPLRSGRSRAARAARGPPRSVARPAVRRATPPSRPATARDPRSIARCALGSRPPPRSPADHGSRPPPPRRPCSPRSSRPAQRSPRHRATRCRRS